MPTVIKWHLYLDIEIDFCFTFLSKVNRVISFQALIDKYFPLFMLYNQTI